MKWVLSTVITIILVPKLQPVVSEYIQSNFINNVGLGLTIFTLTLFLIILIGKTVSKVVTWTGVGSIDRCFGLLFGFQRIYCLYMFIFYFKLVLSLSKIGVYQLKMLFHLI